MESILPWSPFSSNRRYKLALLRDFGGGVIDSIAVSYGTQRREFYTSLDDSSQVTLGVQHNIFQRNASLLEITNQMKYNFDRNISLVVSLGISNNLIDRGYRLKDYLHPRSLKLDSHIQELQFFGNLSLRWLLLDWFHADIRFAYTEREERHSVQEDAQVPIINLDEQRASASRLENTAHRTSLMMGLTIEASRNDRISLVSSIGILRYDTPDTLNTDDRDELLFVSGIEIFHRFSSHLKMALNADLTLSHLVYLHRDQSANNNWNRVIRLSPSVEYTPAPWFRTVARAEVLANYTVSDYEQQVASIRSFSFRQALWSDSAVVRLGERIQCNFSGSLRIFERGTLRWKEFKEKPEEYFIEKSVWPELIWSSTVGLKVGIGFRYFGRDRYEYRGSQPLFAQRIEVLGPTAMIEWSGPGAEKVTINGWREEQKSNGMTTSTISNLSIQVGFIL